MAKRSKLEKPSRSTGRRPRRQEASVRRELRRRSTGPGAENQVRRGDPSRRGPASGTRPASAGPPPRVDRRRPGEPELLRRAREMQVRNLIAVEIAAVVGFALGLLEAMERLPYRPTLEIAEVGLAVAVLVGLAATLRSRERTSERVAVSLLRAGLSGGVFVFVFEGMRLLLKLGHVGLALGSWVWAGVLALLLVRLTPRGDARRRAPTNSITSPASVAGAGKTDPAESAPGPRLRTSRRPAVRERDR